ncbi:hypothetical protein, partial [Pseudonocardia eucalypti]|uniref:hypothetical protein n=1 Tax=Pseudonocardia eucalypti TaxID=648755 RepID=UPI0031E81746
MRAKLADDLDTSGGVLVGEMLSEEVFQRRRPRRIQQRRRRLRLVATGVTDLRTEQTHHTEQITRPNTEQTHQLRRGTTRVQTSLSTQHRVTMEHRRGTG